MVREEEINPLVTALEARRNGWCVIDLPFKSKNPGRAGWQNERLSEAAIRERFSASARNVGVLLGEPSSGLVDIDLDCPEARAVAPFLLPPTPSIFGRPGSSRSHYLYYSSTPPSTTKFLDPSSSSDERAVLLELRSTG